MTSSESDRLDKAAEKFLVPLRLNEGFDSLALANLLNVIDQCGRDWRGRETIPKSAALMLAELWPSTDACAYLHAGEMRQRIVEAAAVIGEHVSLCLDGR
jgi:hypothetical protein